MIFKGKASTLLNALGVVLAGYFAGGGKVKKPNPKKAKEAAVVSSIRRAEDKRARKNARRAKLCQTKSPPKD